MILMLLLPEVSGSEEKHEILGLVFYLIICVILQVSWRNSYVALQCGFAVNNPNCW